MQFRGNLEFTYKEGPKKNWEVIVWCEDCGLPQSMKWISIQKRKKQIHRCRSCAMQLAAPKISRSMTKKWAEDSEYRARVTESIYKWMDTREFFDFCERQSERMLEYFSNPDNRKAYRDKVKITMSAQREAIAERTRAMWKNPEIRARIISKLKKQGDMQALRMELARELHRLGR